MKFPMLELRCALLLHHLRQVGQGQGRLQEHPLEVGHPWSIPIRGDEGDGRLLVQHLPEEPGDAGHRGKAVGVLAAEGKPECIG